MSVSAEPEAGTGHSASSAGGVARNVGWLVAARVSTMVVSLATTAVLARLLTPADFGLMVLVMLAANLATAVVEGGISVPLVQRPTLTAAHVNMAFLLATVASVLLTAAIMLAILASDHWTGDGGPPLVVLVSLTAIPLRAWSSVSSAMLQRKTLFRKATVIALTSAVIGNAIPSVALAVGHFGVWSLAAGLVLSSLIEAVLTARAADLPRFRWPPRALARDFSTAALAGGLMQVVNWAALSSANVIVGTMFGTSALGLFSRAATLVNLVKDLIGTSLSRVLLPAFAGLQGDLVRQGRAFARTLDLMLPIVAVVSVLMVIHSEAVVRLVLGETWLATIPVLQWLSAGLVPRICYKVAETLIMARGGYWAVALRQVIYFLLLVACGCAGLVYGITGVAAGVTCATTVYYLLAVGAAARAVSTGPGLLVLYHGKALAFSALAAAVDLGVLAWSAPLGFWVSHVIAGGLTSAFVLGVLGWRTARLLGYDLSALPRRMRQALSQRRSRAADPVAGGSAIVRP